MNEKDRKQALRYAVEAAFVGGQVQLKYFRRLKNIKEKLNEGLVSEADQESENRITDLLRKKFPSFDILGEEGGLKPSGGRREGLWLIDPLDGTTNYVHGFPFFCVSIGLELEGKIQVGAVHAPLLNMTFTACRSGGSFMNKKPIHVSHTFEIEKSLLATGFSYNRDEVLDSELQDFKHFSMRARGIRRAGSAALDLCMVAQGVFDGFWERQLKPWDTAAGHLIVEEAGGMVTTFDGKPFRFDKDSIVAANPKMHPQIIDTLQAASRR